MKFTLWPIISPIIISVVCMLKKTECPLVWGMGCHSLSIGIRLNLIVLFKYSIFCFSLLLLPTSKHGSAYILYCHQLLPFFFFEAMLWSVYKFRIVISSCKARWINPFIIKKWLYLHLCSLSYCLILSDINIVILVFFYYHLHGIHIFHSFTVNLSVFLSFRWVSYEEEVQYFFIPRKSTVPWQIISYM